MAARILCPSCGKAFNEDKDRDPVRWKKEGCPRCRREAVTGSSSRAAAARNRRDEEDEDDRPRRRQASRDDDDEDDRPRRKKSKKGGSNTMLLVGLGGGGLVVVGLIVVLLVVFLHKKDEDTTKDDTPPAPVVLNPGGQPNPNPGGQINPNPGGQLNPNQDQNANSGQKPDPQPVKVPDTIAKADVTRVMNSTVYLRVQMSKGEVAQGSGFLCMEPGIVMTNAHVLGMLPVSDALPPSQVDVVAHHGEPDELRMTGRVVAVDRNNDLAVLRVPITPQLPPPLAVESANNLIPTQKVYVFGFPLGVQLGKNITVSESSVSSRRLDETTGELKQVQVNGGMQPGNSGGPVTDARGVVIGVSVAIIRGTQLNFAIPGDFVLRLLDGEFAVNQLGAPYRGSAGLLLPLQVNTLDPLRRVKEVKVEVWAGNPGSSRPGGSRTPAAQAGDGPRTKHQLTARAGAYWGDVPLPALQAGQVCWIQPVLVNGSGATLWDTATPVSSDALIVLERRPAVIRIKEPTGDVDRSLRMTNTQTFSLFRDKESYTVVQKLEGPVLESINPDKRPGNLGTAFRLTIGACKITRETPSRTLTAPRDAVATLSRCSPTFLVDHSNACKERGNPNFNALKSPTREDVESFYEMVCNTFESTTLPVPNMEKQPLESWPARAPMLVTDENNKKIVQDIYLTCTYQGLRVEAGRNEAYIALSGQVKSREDKNRGIKSEVLGKATGFALLDVDKGYFSKVKLTVYSEVQLDERGVRMLVAEESLITRTEGNMLGIVPPKQR